MLCGGWANGLTPRQWVYQWIERKQFSRRNSTLVVAPSRRVAEEFRRWHEFGEERLAVVPLGIELDRSPDAGQTARNAFRRRCGLGPDDVAVLFAARNYSLKGLEPLLHSFVAVARAFD